MWSPCLTLLCVALLALHAGAAVAGGGVAGVDDLRAHVGEGRGQHVAGRGVGQRRQNHDMASPLRRGRRKVISRGGHYIVWSRGGTSPWSSTTYDAMNSPGSVGRHHREYSWHPPGERVGDGGLQGYVGPQGRSPGAGGLARKKLNQSFKREIAQYAMVYGVRQAAVHYEHAVGRRLRDRVVAKFVNRYQERKKRKRRRRRRRLGHS
ncbi:uncharacterized protein LOC123498074 isoform X2 [Portunus trituberculatus]|uniref:uncharacterized protein LOC123498074 isoform X2 n=1 Tax=Portunus trituberculatus TaxID=210409 RepID=UPI001E1D1948|nr:uncharacterized protein LOC123498074 isoform X2 [Portunus trituberculatus]